MLTISEHSVFYRLQIYTCDYRNVAGDLNARTNGISIKKKVQSLRNILVQKKLRIIIIEYKL